MSFLTDREDFSIGDYVDICAGAQIYSHDTVRRVQSGGVDPIDYAPTRIGSRVFIGAHKR